MKPTHTPIWCDFPPQNLFTCHNWLGCVGGVPPPDVQLYARHGDQVEQDHQRPRVELVQCQQSRGETFFFSNVSMSMVPIFPPVTFLTVILSNSWGRVEAELRDLKAWPVGYWWRSCACVYIVRTKGKLTKIINGPVWKLYNFSRAEVQTFFSTDCQPKKCMLLLMVLFSAWMNDHNSHSKVCFLTSLLS